MKELQLDNERISKKIVNFLKREFKKRNKTVAILGLSGGIDSTISGFLCKKAGLDLYGVVLPYKNKGLNWSKKAVRSLSLSFNRTIVIDIASCVDAQVKKIQEVIKLNRGDKGNVMARQRMVVQYALSKSLNGLVMGTENLSEYYLGYFTLYGDEACDISPISGLFKTQVYKLAEYLRVPKDIIKRRPTAGLWSGQTDERELGFSYRKADPILYLSLVRKYSEEKIIRKGFNSNLVKKVLERVKNTEYKRQKTPKPFL